MELAHETALNDLMRDVLDHGVAKVEGRLLLRWHDRTNWGKGIWQSLNQRFTKLLTERGEENDDWRLYVIPDGPVISLLCFNPDDVTSWWRPADILV